MSHVSAHLCFCPSSRFYIFTFCCTLCFAIIGSLCDQILICYSALCRAGVGSFSVDQYCWPCSLALCFVDVCDSRRLVGASHARFAVPRWNLASVLFLFRVLRCTRHHDWRGLYFFDLVDLASSLLLELPASFWISQSKFTRSPRLYFQHLCSVTPLGICVCSIVCIYWWL